MKAASKSKATWRLCQLDQREVEVGDDVDAPAPFDCGRGTRECFFWLLLLNCNRKTMKQGGFRKPLDPVRTIGFDPTFTGVVLSATDWEAIQSYPIHTMGTVSFNVALIIVFFFCCHMPKVSTSYNLYIMIITL